MIEKIKDNLKFIIIIILLILLGGIIVYYYMNSSEENDYIKEEKLEKKKVQEKPKEEKFFFVDIKGAVNSEGVYKLKENSRVIDVINEAGGLKENADTSIINLSKRIFDEMFIVIYTKEEIEKYKNETLSTKEINNKIEKNILVIDENNDANIKSISKSSKEKDENKLVNINTALKDELLLITGIGESKAEAIISYRLENGKFKTIEDIKNVTGIGEALFEKIKDSITV